MKQHIIYGTLLTIVTIVFGVFIGIQYTQINSLRESIAIMKVEKEENTDMEKTQMAILEVNQRLEDFIVIHDENVDIINEMNDDLYTLINYLASLGF